jgi:hypothetical protein
MCGKCRSAKSAAGVPKLKLISLAPRARVENDFCVLYDERTRDLVCGSEMLLHNITQRTLY